MTRDTASSEMGWYLSYPNPNVSIDSTGSANLSSIGSPSRLSMYGDNSSLCSVTSVSTISDDSFRRSSVVSSRRGGDSVSARSSFRNSQYVVGENSQRFYPGVPDHLLIFNNANSSSTPNSSELRKYKFQLNLYDV